MLCGKICESMRNRWRCEKRFRCGKGRICFRKHYHRIDPGDNTRHKKQTYPPQTSGAGDRSISTTTDTTELRRSRLVSTALFMDAGHRARNEDRKRKTKRIVEVLHPSRTHRRRDREPINAVRAETRARMTLRRRTTAETAARRWRQSRRTRSHWHRLSRVRVVGVG